MKKYKIKIGYMISFDVNASNKEEAEDIAWNVYDEQVPEPKILIKEINNKRNKVL